MKIKAAVLALCLGLLPLGLHSRDDHLRSTIDAARPLTARGLQNLVAFARLYGYIRYFHPSDESASIDWERFTVDGMCQVEGAASDAELAEKLSALFQPVAPTLTILTTGSPYRLPPELLATMDAPGRRITYWQHHGLGSQSNGSRSPYRSERVQRAATGRGKTPLPHAPWRADLGGLTAWIPLALYVDSQGTLPHSSGIAQPLTSVPTKYSADDRSTRLADVIIAWNVFQHFYPYVDVVDTDWPATLNQALKSAATDSDGDAFTLTLRRLVHNLQDGHGRVDHNTGRRMLPLQWEWVENQLVVTAVGTSIKDRISPGDAVISINGKPVIEAIADAEALVSGATPQWVRFRALQELATSWTGETSADIVIQPFRNLSRTITLALPFEPATHEPLQEPRPAKVAELEPGIHYLDPARMSDDEFLSAIPQLAKARGIIFDFRRYPRISPVFLTHLSDRNLASSQWHVPLVVWPDGRDMRFERGGEWKLKPASPLFTAKVAFITDGRAISYAESCLGIVEHYRLGAIIGAPTAGTNGDVNMFELPGGYRISWTGMKVLKHDGSRHHGVGILPTIPVTKTRAAIASGQDEFLQAAIETVSR